MPTNYGSSGAATTDQDFADELVVEQPAGKTWLRRHWCWIVRIVLAIVGITVPLVMFLQPCEDRLIVDYTYVKQPVDLFLLLDGSGSMRNDWEACVDAAANMTQVFADSDISNLWIGSGEFDSYAYTTGDYTNDTDLALQRLRDLSPQWGKTYYQRALTMYKTSWQNFDKPANSFSLLVIVSDGVPTDTTKGIALARALRNATHPNGVGNEIKIAGIFVGSDSEDATKYLRDVSNCDQCEVGDDLCTPAWGSSDTCPYFLTFSDFDEFNEKAKVIADELQDEVGSVERRKEAVRCVKAPWLGFLALLLPLLCVLCMPLFVRKKRTYKRRVKKAPSVVVKPPSPEEFRGPAPPPPPPEAMPGFKKPRFKWKIKANDHYLWGGSAKPMPVAWGKRGATESAPRDPLAVGSRKAIVINQIDEGDGYIIEEIEEDRTLEQWTEDAVEDIASSTWRTICCCCAPKYDKMEDEHDKL